MPYVVSRLLYRKKVNVVHSRTKEIAIAELKVFLVPECDNYPEGFKYSMFLVYKESGKVIFGFDNHKPKGHHLHFKNKEVSYIFSGTEQLLKDFWGLAEKEGFIL